MDLLKKVWRGKYLFLYFFFGFAFVLLIFRYAQIQLLFNNRDFEELLKRYPERRVIVIPGWRGAIYTSDGMPLAITIGDYLFYTIGKNLSPDAVDIFAENFAPVFGVTPSYLRNFVKQHRGYAVFNETANDTVYKEFLKVRRQIWKEEVDLSKKVFGKPVTDRITLVKFCQSLQNPDIYQQRLCALREVLDWVGVQRGNKRVYPQNRFLSNTVGFVNRENRGVAGVELMEDANLYSGPIKIPYLFGSSKFRLITEPVGENIGKNLTADVYLTIDYTVQAILERVKEEIVNRWHPKKVVIMLMDIHTGKILGLATYPDFDPNNVKSLNGTSNPAFADVFEMGSVIKPFFVGLAFYLKKVHPGEKIKIGRGVRVGHHIVRDAERLPPYLTVEDVLVHSSNIGTVRIAKRLPPEAEKELIETLKWNKRISNFPGSSAGLVPSLKLPANRLYIAFGQGLALTPAHLVSSYAALITGYAPVPQLIEKVVREDGKILYEFKPKYLNPDRPLFDNRTRQWLKEIFKQIVLRGTAKKANPYYYVVGGKTGTAQVYDRRLKRYSKTRYVTSFIGFFPYPEPKYVLLVMVDEPKAKARYLIYGGTVAAPYWREIVNEVSSYLGLKPTPNVKWLEKVTRGAVKASN